MRVGVLQFAPEFGEVERNLDRVAGLLGERSADVWVLPELFATGYLFTESAELVRLAEPLHGRTVARLRGWAREHRCVLAAGLAEAAPGGCYNSAVLVGPDGLLAHYRKVHLFDRETLWFAPGDLGFPVVDVDGVRLGLMICYDWRYPESARSLAFAGADLILHPSNLVLPWCPDAMVTRALENVVFIATADRTGTDRRGGEELSFIGRSQVVSTRGEVLARLGEEEGVAVVEIDPSLARRKQVTAHNHLWRDLRPEHYRRGPD